MSSQRYSSGFKDEVVRQIVERGYPVAEVSERLGVSSHSLYKWVKAVTPDKTEQNTADLVEAKSEVSGPATAPPRGRAGWAPRSEYTADRRPRSSGSTMSTTNRAR